MMFPTTDCNQNFSEALQPVVWVRLPYCCFEKECWKKSSCSHECSEEILSSSQPVKSAISACFHVVKTAKSAYFLGGGMDMLRTCVISQATLVP